MLGVLLSSSPLYALRQGLSLKVELSHLTQLAGQQVTGTSSFFASLVLGFQGHTAMPSFDVSTGNINLGLLLE